VSRNRVTLQTIADRLGVSRTTVSNAYNRPDQLAPELREKVPATAAELGYTGPDAAARRLRSGSREAVGLLSTGWLSYAFTDPAAVLFMQGFAGALEREGLGLLMLPGRGYGSVRVPDAIRDAVVAGFCLHSLPAGSEDLDAVVARGLPIVLVDEPRTGAHTFIGIDDEQGARLAAEHLLELGHRRIGAVCFRTTDDDYDGPITAEREAGATYPVSRARLRGWREPLEAAGIPPEDHPRIECAWNSLDAGAAAVRRLLTERPQLTAILFSSDQLALGGRRAARDIGRADVSIVGYDDIPEAAHLWPPLTTIRQDFAELGRRCLTALLGGDDESVSIVPELVVRGTTAPPRA
jgi:DNA-binding LacI/PurR family transcriptional regulator